MRVRAVVLEAVGRSLGGEKDLEMLQVDVRAMEVDLVEGRRLLDSCLEFSSRSRDQAARRDQGACRRVYGRF